MLISIWERVSSFVFKGLSFLKIDFFFVVAPWSKETLSDVTAHYKKLRGLQTFSTLLLNAPSSLKTVRKSASIMNSFHLVKALIPVLGTVANPDSISCSQLCQIVSLLTFRADETRRRLAWAKAKTEMRVGQTLHTFTLKEHDWVIFIIIGWLGLVTDWLEPPSQVVFLNNIFIHSSAPQGVFKVV